MLLGILWGLEIKEGYGLTSGRENDFPEEVTLSLVLQVSRKG